MFKTDSDVDISFEEKVINELSSDFIFKFLPRGFGNTFGNSIRRILLSYISGAAISSVRIHNVPHIFSGIVGVSESYLDIVANLKKISFDRNTILDDGMLICINVDGPCQITADILTKISNIKIYNKELVILNVNAKINFCMDIFVKKGVGYVVDENNKRKDCVIEEITLDTVYSPVTLANFSVSNSRVGAKVDFDDLVITIHSNGSVTPKNILLESLSIFSFYLSSIKKFVE